MPNDFETGLHIVPPSEEMREFVPALGATELPESYIVPAFRHWFDDDFNVIPDKVFTTRDGKAFVHDQGYIDSCVGHGGAIVKTDHEGVPKSARDIWGQTKLIDAERGHPLDAYGATIWALMDAMENGAADESTVPSPPNGRTRAQYLSMDYVDDKVLAERASSRGGKKAYYVTRDKMKSALYQTGHAMVTFCGWHSGDNLITDLMGMPSGDYVGGHCFSIIGWIRNRRVFANSWGKRWGKSGLFFIEEGQVMNRLTYAYIHVDAADPLPGLLARYDGKDLRRVGTNELWRCELGVLRKYPDEITWWAFGKLFGFDTFDIMPTDFEAIPKGKDMDIADAPASTRELVRQVRQHYGKL